MIDYLRGRLVAVRPGRVVLEVGGVGLHIETPPSMEALQQQIGQEAVFYTRLVLREEEANLYGFRSADERNLFNLVLGVSGFGPRLALALLGVLSAAQFCAAIMEENFTLLCQAPGVGRKVAQRLVLELKEKLPRTIALDTIEILPADKLSPRDDVIEALCGLGYSRLEASTAVNRIMREAPEAQREELLKLALKGMATGNAAS
ncbi:MAG: Holliday junction branch migration protein RuvA [Bacillota bacterium]